MKEISVADRIKYNAGSTLTGIVGTIFFEYVQENAYGRPNMLQGVSESLGDQTSLTSLFAVLALTAFSNTCFSIIEWNEQGNIDTKQRVKDVDPTYGYAVTARNFWRGLQAVYPAVLGLCYSFYEYNQALNPSYHDNHSLDTAFGLASSLAIAAPVLVPALVKSIRR